MLRAATSRSPLSLSAAMASSARLLQGLRDRIEDQVGGGGTEGGADEDAPTEAPEEYNPCSNDPSWCAGASWCNDINKNLCEQGYTEWEIVGIVIASIVAFFVALCVINIFLGIIQHYTRRRAMEAKAKAAGGGEGGGDGGSEERATAALSNSRAGRSEKDK